MQNIEIVGNIGEKIIANEFTKRKYSVEIALDPYDSTKDLLIDGKQRVEVKTGSPFVHNKLFKEGNLAFRKNQLRKCRSVDMLFFVAPTPPIKGGNNYKWAAHIFQVDPRNFTYREYSTKKGAKDMIGIGIYENLEAGTLRIIRKLTDEEDSQLQKYLVTNY